MYITRLGGPYSHSSGLTALFCLEQIEATPMKISKAHISVGEYDETYRSARMDVIEHAGKFWLVPQWIDVPAQKLTTRLRATG